MNAIAASELFVYTVTATAVFTAGTYRPYSVTSIFSGNSHANNFRSRSHVSGMVPTELDTTRAMF